MTVVHFEPNKSLADNRLRKALRLAALGMALAHQAGGRLTAADIADALADPECPDARRFRAELVIAARVKDPSEATWALCCTILRSRAGEEM